MISDASSGKGAAGASRRETTTLGRSIVPLVAMAALAAVWVRTRSTDSASEATRADNDAVQVRDTGWPRLQRVVVDTYKRFARDRIVLVAAGLTFFGLLAIFPAITAMVSIYGLVSDPTAVREHVDLLAGVLPGGAMEILREQLDRLVSQDRAALGFGLALSLAVAFWTANGGMKSLFTALNIVHDEDEGRGLLKLTLVTLGFTVAMVLFFVTVLAVIVALPLGLQWVGLQADSLLLVRWPLLLAVVVLLLAVVFRYGPDRRNLPWRGVVWGAVVASVLWLALSILFSWYVQNFGSYNKTYGSLGAVIGFMTWMWLSWIVILLGAELNASLEREGHADDAG
ncbi:MAG: YihY/virulence factor BrkB family protein [Reyranellaceae bacterium]